MGSGFAGVAWTREGVWPSVVIVEEWSSSDSGYTVDVRGPRGGMVRLPGHDLWCTTLREALETAARLTPEPIWSGGAVCAAEEAWVQQGRLTVAAEAYIAEQERAQTEFEAEAARRDAEWAAYKQTEEYARKQAEAAEEARRCKAETADLERYVAERLAAVR